MVKTLPFSARDEGLIPSQGAKIHMPCSQKTTHEKHKQYFNKLNKDFKRYYQHKKSYFIYETFYKTLMVAKICLKKRHKIFNKKERKRENIVNPHQTKWQRETGG